jgi:RimJ/RimL family protein N-acetyltransferase
MAENGNPNQWGPTQWPPEALLRRDIARGDSYVCVHEDRVVGTFYFICGKDIEPTYAEITDGAWLDDSPYGVIHRIAVASHGRGVASFCFAYALSQCPNLKIDTHADNLPMQRALEKNGFSRCGIIHLENGEERIAFQKTV